MKKFEYLNGSIAQRQTWLADLKKQITQTQNSISPKLQDYLNRQLTERDVQDAAGLLKKRTTIILYLNDAWDATESPPYNEVEIRFTMGLLTPDDFDPDSDCIYCLKNFQSFEELQKHYETCSI